ncbi:N,N-dimethylformamidase beta subunit family domain-containing protein [Kitasatospora sp. NPDC089913]|uniref:N,N-dimethylformamidase beta subunit family domain-containing protein n=1 Tax=Kitasatospora sp. NPDC089913 TaxID=3364080 RepID=UPI003823320B
MTAPGPDGTRRRAFLALAAGAGLLAGTRPAWAATATVRAGTGTSGDGGSGIVSASGAGLDVLAENALPGNADWRITDPGPPEAVEGFADRVSVLPGEPFGLHVSTTAPGFTVRAYRTGWYGGARARLVYESEPLPGVRRNGPTLDSATRTVRTDWPRSLTVPTDGWPEGSYLLRLDAVGGTGQRYVPVTVRCASAAGRTLLVNAVATWQAYNLWGGYNLYYGPTGRRDSRSLTVGFDRPYRYADGAGLFLVYEAPLIALAERLGLPLAYATGPDLDREEHLLTGANCLVSPGHDEYWSVDQRQRVAAARDSGTNLAVLGANCCFRRVRYEDSPLGARRTVVCYKGDYERDPGYLQGLPPTTDFRAEPAPDPESTLLGVLYGDYPVDAPFVVTNPGHWLYEGTGVRAGDSFEHLVGVEYDRVDTAWPTPRPVEILAHSPVVCEGRPDHSDSTYLTLPTGAAVFASGTMRWVESLEADGPADPRNHGLDGAAGAFTRTVTTNVLRAFAAGPAGIDRPARDNVVDHYPAPAAGPRKAGAALPPSPSPAPAPAPAPAPPKGPDRP